jgi:hypothetical protein
MFMACGGDDAGDVTLADAGNDATSPVDGGGGDGSSDSGPSPFKDGSASDTGTGGAPLIYAHTDTELYTMDPKSMAVTLVGTFSDGTTTLGSVTDLAVNAAGEVWVNTAGAIFRAAVPSAPGPVQLTKVTDITLKASQKFYALGFTLPGTLGPDEKLVAGDNLGELYAVEANGTTVALGNFGTDAQSNRYELSGDVMFFAVNGQPRGLATLRSCKGTTCVATNDLLAEIDVAAMQAAYTSKTPGNMRKSFLGTGTGVGKLFGIGGWNDSVYAFSRNGTNPAELVQIGANGVGKVLQSFPQISAGWSGAGVTTSASVTILPN